MIERKGLWISLFILAAMIAATAWRLSLLPDWQHIPSDGPANARTIHLFWLLWSPCGLGLTVAFLFARRWLISGPREAVQRWGRYSGLFLIFYSLMIALMQAFILARSLGLGLSLDRHTVACGIFIMAGIMMMIMGNALPKMPLLSSRLRPLRLDAWQWNRHLRFTGRLLVAMGLFLALILPLLPVKILLPATTAMWLAVMAGKIWHLAHVKREAAPLS